MEEQPKSSYKVKSRNEMKVINVVFVSDELVGGTIVNRKEYDRTLRQRGKTEEAETVNPGKSRKRKASEVLEENVNPKRLKIDEVELAHAALVQEDEGNEDVGKEVAKKGDEGKGTERKGDANKKFMNRKEKNKKDTNKEGISKKDKIKMGIGKEDASKKDKSKRDTEKKDKKEEDTDRKNTGNKNSEKENVEAEGEVNVPLEQLRILMGDEKDMSSSEDYTTGIVALKPCDLGEGSSQNEEKGIINSSPRSSRCNETKQQVTTPYSLRKRVLKDFKKIRRILENSDTEDDDVTTSEGEFLESSEESETEEKGETTGEQPVPSTSAAINYFEAQSVKRNITSNNTLKKLKNPTLTQKELNKIVRKFKLSPGHRSAIKSLINETTKCFSKWDFLLKNNFNILLYGVGSKREIVNNFVDRFARKYPLIVVNGFFPDLSVREITEKICQILEIGVTKIDITAEINRKLNEYDVEIYIVVNNIDGLMLRNKKTQTILSQYAKMEGIHILATIDHINAPLMWDKSTFSDFNWIWYDATTFLNYTDEVVYEGNIMLQGNGKLTLSSLRNVYYSLTKNSRAIFLLMAKRELNSPYGVRRGLSFKELYQACRKELLISSDVALRSLLKEFIDHAIVKTKKNSDGDEVFVITLETNILKQFMDDQENR